MIACELDESGHNVIVTFTVGDWVLDGEQLCVVGDFNDWQAGQINFEPRSTGRWQATAVLQGGRSYRFRYLRSDGTWLNDEAAHGYADNEHGGQDSILNLTETGPGDPPG